MLLGLGENKRDKIIYETTQMGLKMLLLPEVVFTDLDFALSKS